MPPTWKPKSINVEIPVSKGEIPVSNHLKLYALFQIFFCVVGTILLLIYEDFLPKLVFIIGSIICVLHISKAVMIFKENIYKNFENEN
jgi:hypothetical protein